jgi:hypothetical protein
MGFSIAPGAFDGDTLLGQPLLLAYAWATMVASYASILLGVLYLRSLAGGRISSLRPDSPGPSTVRGTGRSTGNPPGRTTG